MSEEAFTNYLNGYDSNICYAYYKYNFIYKFSSYVFSFPIGFFLDLSILSLSLFYHSLRVYNEHLYTHNIYI